mmetsp:Transcript_142760/g.248984  ORF Transcript_142760/g.248984 Transcript_142760/m.248984 type:complete len:227 (-) Transcript_142760:28-708(-)
MQQPCFITLQRGAHVLSEFLGRAHYAPHPEVAEGSVERHALPAGVVAPPEGPDPDRVRPRVAGPVARGVGLLRAVDVHEPAVLGLVADPGQVVPLVVPQVCMATERHLAHAPPCHHHACVDDLVAGAQRIVDVTKNGSDAFVPPEVVRAYPRHLGPGFHRVADRANLVHDPDLVAVLHHIPFETDGAPRDQRGQAQPHEVMQRDRRRPLPGVAAHPTQGRMVAVAA